MRALCPIVLAAVLPGCGAAAAARPASIVAAEGAAIAAPQDREETARIRELESRLALRTAELRELRAREEERAEAAPEVVRIGEQRCGEGDPIATAEPEPVEEDGGPRPLLRLYGTAPIAAPPSAFAPLPGPIAPSVVPAPPQPATFARLPVTGEGIPAIPDQPITVAPAPLASPARTPEDDPIVREYQRALAEVEARRWDAALEGLERFARDHSEHPYADNALYWRAEVLYARRDYRRALRALEALIVRYPDGNKVPDALLRIGYCLQRLGDPDRARETFRRLREQFPDTVAARMASREET